MSIENEYKDLAVRADSATKYHSSIPIMMGKLPVQEIVKLGAGVLPSLFNDLTNKKFGIGWRMAAIRAILENNGLPPVEIPDELRGRVVEMVRIHVEYGHDHGYI